jgi:catechol 2,3-dioxygenase-like lactoylglutathione lyase family enzyme
MSIVGLDHTGLAVEDLDAAADAFEALGFRVMDRSVLMQPGADGTDVSSGAENRVVMFSQGYQELIQITDPSRGHVIVPRLGRYRGVHIMVLKVEDAAAEHARLAALGVGLTPVTTWTRKVADGIARFRFFLVEDSEVPEATLCLVEHQTPELIRPKGSLDHPNGVIGLEGATLCVADAAEAERRFTGIFGRAPKEGRFVFDDGTWIALSKREAMQEAFPGASVPPAPSVAAIAYRVADLGAFPGPVQQSDSRTWIAPADAAGALIAISAAQRQ